LLVVCGAFLMSWLAKRLRESWRGERGSGEKQRGERGSGEKQCD
jgi:hypothetical protein